MRTGSLALLCLTVACGDSDPAAGGRLGLSVTQAAAGSCPNGGIDIHQGVDRNGNGQIDADEVTWSETVCNGKDGDSCSVADNGNGTKTITCEDDTSVTVADGVDGKDGDSCSVADNGDGTKTIACGGDTPVTIHDGADGIVVTTTLSCSGQLGATGTWVAHTAQITSAGDVFYQCSFYEGTGDASKSGFYHHEQVGALDAACTTSYFGYDFLIFRFTYSSSLQSLIDTVEYFDVSTSVTTPAATWELNVSNCIVNQY